MNYKRAMLVNSKITAICVVTSVLPLANSKSTPVPQKKLSNTEPLHKFKAEDFDAVFYPGGHGPLWDLATDKDSLRLIADMIKLGRPVAAVCMQAGGQSL